LQPVFIPPKPTSNKVTREAKAFYPQAERDAASLGKLVENADYPLIFSGQPPDLNANINYLNLGVD
jgi:hypothetical protein